MIRSLLIRLLLFWGGGERDMVIVYATLIIKGHIEFADVPTGSQAAVQDTLQALGYNTDGTPIGSGQ